MKKQLLHSVLAAAILTTGTIGGFAPSALATPASGEQTQQNAAVSDPAVLKPLNLSALRETLAGLPNAKATAALVFVGTPTDSWMGASGAADIETGAPARADGRFRIGSITKVFTATVVLQLVAEQKVDLNEPIQTYVPNLLPADYPPVTVGQLLNHTSGLPSPVLPEGTTILDLMQQTWTPEQYVQRAFQNPMEFEPGTMQHYVNINYFLAGILIEQVTGNTFESEVESRIIQPLHLSGTSLPGQDSRLDGPHSQGYQSVDRDGKKELVNVTEGSQTFHWASGDMISTATDLDTFMSALYRGELLPPDVLKNMFTVPDVPVWKANGKEGGPATMSMGLSRTEFKGVVIWGKTGARPGYANGMFATRDLERRVVYSVNSTDAKGTDENTVGINMAMTAFGFM